MSTSSLYCLKLDPTLRKNIAGILVPTSKIKVRTFTLILVGFTQTPLCLQDILYVIMVAQERVITLVRPKKHSIHPSGMQIAPLSPPSSHAPQLDLHVLINTIHAPSIMNNSASASWLPICLPKFNPTGFVNAYVTFLHKGPEDPVPSNAEDDGNPSETASLGGSSTHTISQGSGATTITKDNPVTEELQPKIGLVCVSGVADFEAVKTWCEIVVEVGPFTSLPWHRRYPTDSTFPADGARRLAGLPCRLYQGGRNDVLRLRS